MSLLQMLTDFIYKVSLYISIKPLNSAFDVVILFHLRHLVGDIHPRIDIESARIFTISDKRQYRPYARQRPLNAGRLRLRC